MRNQKRIKRMACVLLIAMSVAGCKGGSEGNTGTANVQPDVTQRKEVSEDVVGEAVSVQEKREELSICDSHPLCFKIGDTEVTLEESLGVAILEVQWVNDEQIGVTINVERSVNCFVLYNVKTSTYGIAATGTDFVWKGEDIRTLAYVESTPSGTGEMGHYWIKDYDGNIIYESKEEVAELSYGDDDKLHFKVQTADGWKEETVSLDKTK